MKRSVTVVGVGLQPQDLLCPGVSHWGDWDLGADTGQMEHLSSAAGGIHTAHMCVYFPLTKLHPDEPEG